MDKQYKVATYTFGPNSSQYNVSLADLNNKIDDMKSQNIPNGNSVNGIKKIVDLMIQAPAKTKFIINESSQPILIGENKTFSWHVENDNGFIYSIKYADYAEDWSSKKKKKLPIIITYGYYEE